ncbi:MAG TPA: GNAT family N-acetyltransferase [Lacibacter sp.]|nr:GNAT family N-acetyltransferase [Lacibacter sp.]
MFITNATSEDVSFIVQLLNSAYRGATSRQGWTTEAHLIAGDVRTNEESVLQVMEQPDSVILKCCDDDGRMVGTVNLQQQASKIYLGMFAVAPALQGKGIGKQLLEAAENHARNTGCTAIYMHVISVRNELINWYRRHGYRDTGLRKPFVEDGLTGRHLQPLEFAVLEKEV